SDIATSGYGEPCASVNEKAPLCTHVHDICAAWRTAHLYAGGRNRAHDPRRPTQPMATPSHRVSQQTLRRPDELASGYIFDLDGTLYLGDDLLPGARRLIA